MKPNDRAGKFVRVAAALTIALLLPDTDGLVMERVSALSKNANAGEGPPVPARTTPPARDPAIAVQEEYELARRRGTAQALELFIARHPDDPLAEKARAGLAAMKR